MKDLEELQQELSTYNNIRKINPSGQIEVKIHRLNKNNKSYWNIMINDFVRDISIRWHVKEDEYSFDDIIKIYYHPLTKYFKNRNDIGEIISKFEKLQVDLINAYG